MSRLSALTPENMTPEQKEVYDDIINGPRKSIPAPLMAWLRRPELARHAQVLGCYTRYGSRISLRLSEVIIMLLARHWNAEYQWQTHKPQALAAGISEKILDAIRDGNIPEFAEQDENLVYRIIRQLHMDKHIDDPLYVEAVSMFGEDGVVDLVGLFAYYSFISVTIQVFDLSKTCTGEPELSRT